MSLALVGPILADKLGAPVTFLFLMNAWAKMLRKQFRIFKMAKSFCWKTYDFIEGENILLSQLNSPTWPKYLLMMHLELLIVLMFLLWRCKSSGGKSFRLFNREGVRVSWGKDRLTRATICSYFRRC